LKKEVNYKDGERDGLQRKWYENGQLKYEGNYKDSERDGLQRAWYENGQLEEEFNFKDGEVDGLNRKWYENGQLSSEVNKKDGEVDGLSRKWYENGQLNLENNFKDGKLDGLQRTWYENGQLEDESNWKDDETIGLIKTYNKFGDLSILFPDGSSSGSVILEDIVREYLDNQSDLDPYEGLYRFSSMDKSSSAQYLFLIIKSGYNYNGYIVSANCVGCDKWKIGDVKFQMTEGSMSGIFDVTWKYPSAAKQRAQNFIFTGEFNGGVLKSSNGNIALIKLHPKLSSTKNNRIKAGEWAGNGSGLIISKSGHIVTNHHVIEGADAIEVEFIINGEIKKFNAEVVQVDKTNDLAIIKIFDMGFDGLDNLSYNFKTRSSDVGTKVYAFGYPMALTVMGKEIKVTDGIISSKSGFDGNITTYQISAPIQGGNSGGPLFDDKANFIGINSSGLRKDVADNVAYTIKSSYVLNLIDVLPKSIELPSNTKLQSLPLTEQIKEISKYVVLIKVK
jgi:antitoxin component YwqK of YwqJK toxin-antitoxin module/S1-C subfamily serine protease